MVRGARVQVHQRTMSPLPRLGAPRCLRRAFRLRWEFPASITPRATSSERPRGCRSHRLPIAIGAFGVAGIAAAAVFEPSPRFVWNGSASVPLGLYRIAQCPCEVGDLVLAHLPAWMSRLAFARGYLPVDTAILKRIAAAASDEICRREYVVSINGTSAANARSTDQHGRPMPVWRGCRVLRADEIFLLNDHPASFDGRYLGVTKRSQIVGRAVPIWTYVSHESKSPK